jgi:tellurite resistance protein TehA-like permease
MENRDNNSGENLLKAIASLSDWSKWLIGVNFGAATGCVLVLRGGAAEAVRPMLLLAIIFFALSVLCSSLFVFLLSVQVEKIGETNEVKYKPIGIIQLLLFGAGVVSLLAWVVKLSGVFG